MTPQEILDAIDVYFDEIVYPTMVMLESWMKQVDPSQFNAKDVHIPPRLLKQARERVKEIINQQPVISDPSDVQIDNLMRKMGDTKGGNLRVPGDDLRKAIEGP